MADGSIIIDTKIDTSGADQDLSGMEKSARKFMEEYEKNGANAVKHQNELRTEIEKTKAENIRLKKELDRLKKE